MVSLVERPDLITVTAGWAWNEWGQRSGRTLEQSVERRSKMVVENGFEQCFVVLDDDVPAGMASLVHADLEERPDLTPWLAGVFVPPAFRGRGHAMRAVRGVEDAAATHGCKELWLYTPNAMPLYAKLGWQHVELFQRSSGKEYTLMRRDLTPETP